MIAGVVTWSRFNLFEQKKYPFSIGQSMVGESRHEARVDHPE